MRSRHSNRAFILLVTVLGLAAASLEPAAQSDARDPWYAYADPRAAGFSESRLEEARRFADANRAAAVMAVYRGHVIAAWGAVDRPLMAHSVRKSLAGSLYGIAAYEGRWSLDVTLVKLGIDDDPPLTSQEKQARVRDLLAARSGVYHGAAYADVEQEQQRPRRDSHAPGTFWFYNNWDFNAAEAIYQEQTGEDLYVSFDRRIARPIGMEDFEPLGQLRVLEPSQSRFAAHTFRISARDLARFGQLYLQEGRWGGRQIVPREWVHESFQPHSITGERTGYGYLWWIYEPGSLGDAYPTLNRQSVYLARGTGGQALFVLPAAEMVVVHRGDTDNGRTVAGSLVWPLVERLVAAKEHAQVATPALGPMRVLPLTSNLPAPVAPALVVLEEAALRRFSGEYVFPEGIARVFVHDGRLFMSLTGQGEAELFAIGPTTFTIKVQNGILVAFTEKPGGAVSGVEVTMGRRKIQALRR